MSDDRDDAPSALVPLQGTAEPSREASPWAGLLDGFHGVTRRCVVDAFLPYTVKLEGAVAFMYLDQIGLVTTAIGNLIDTSMHGGPKPYAPALAFPWRRPDGSLASSEEVIACWELVKAHQAIRAGGGVAYGKIPGNDLRLDRAGVAGAVRVRLELNDHILTDRFRLFATWPADAQLGVHSMAWGAGAEFHYPHFEAWVSSTPPNFAAAAPESDLHIQGHEGPIARNLAQREMFFNAARVQDEGLDPDVLIYRPPSGSAGWVI